MKYLITGTGRCGTGWAAQVLSGAGIPCTHEGVFTPEGYIIPTALAESSWMAAVALNDLGSETRVIHLIRHPYRVIESQMRLRFFADNAPSQHKPYMDFVTEELPGIWLYKSEQERATCFVLEWNRMIEECTGAMRVRAEDGPAALLDACGIDHGPDETLYDDTHYNHRRGWPAHFNPTLLPAELHAGLAAMMNRYGYEPPKIVAEPQVFWAVLWERYLPGLLADYLMSVASMAALEGYGRISTLYGRVDTVRNDLVDGFLSLNGHPDDVLVMLDNDHHHPYNGT